MLMWYTKSTSTGTYTQRPTPSSYKLDLEDLDKVEECNLKTSKFLIFFLEIWGLMSTFKNPSR